MSDNLMSRRKFLVSAGTVAAAAGLAGVGLAKSASPAVAAPTAPPWPYPTSAAEQPDPETLARHAYEVYYAAGCAEATWWPLIEFLSSKSETDPLYAPWATLPRNVLKFGGGGVGGWGTLCGTCNGSAGVIALCGGPAKITDEIMQYYAETPLPTNGIDKAFAAGWVPSPFGANASGPITAPNPLPNVPTATAHSQLCHASIAQWTMVTGKADGSADQKDRCAKACYDLVLKTTALLNAYFLDKTNLPAGALDSSIASCQTGCHSGLHGSAKGKMACDSCHDETGAGPHED
jgi:hypothetical protein